MLWFTPIFDLLKILIYTNWLIKSYKNAVLILICLISKLKNIARTKSI